MGGSNNNYDLDLTKIATENHEKLADKIETYYREDSALKTQFAWHWERNHLMLDGKQWLIQNSDSNGSGRIWTELTVQSANEYIPRPVTNYLYDIYQTLKSYLIQTRPRSTVTPNTDTHKDKQAAKLAELVNECNWERLHEEKNYEYAAATACVYGTVFKKDYWDTTSLQMAKIPRTEEQPNIDPMTGQVIGMEEKEVLDEFGNPIVDEIPLGDVNTAIVEPYKIALDPLAADLHDARWLVEYNIQPINIVQQLYDKRDEMDQPAEGYTGAARDLKEEKYLSNSLRRFFELKTSSGTAGVQGSFPGLTSTTSNADMIDNAVVVKEYYERPSEEHPKGRLIVVANKKVLYAGESPYQGPEQGDWHPYSEFRWEVVPGRFWGKSFMDDLVELQKRINSLDSTIILTRKTMAIPQKLSPKTAGIKKGEWTGRPGQVIEYRPDQGAKPEIIPPVGVDSQVWQEREQIIQAMHQISGAVDILKGNAPADVTAASAFEILHEIATGKLKPVLDRWKRFIEDSQKGQLKLVATKYREPRPDYIKLLKSKNSEFPEESIDQFIGTDIYDNCNITVEAGSNLPKLEAAKKAQIMQAAQTGALQLEVPENRMQFLKDLGISGYDKQISPDVKRAEWENDILKDIGIHASNPPVVLDVDDHHIHKDVHSRRMKEPSYMELDSASQQAFIAHIQEHDMYIQMAQQQQMLEAAMTGVPPSPTSGAGDPQQLAARGKGVPSKTAKEILKPE